MKSTRTRFFILLTLMLLVRTTCSAGFIDITGLTPGPAGIASFTATLDGVALTGVLAGAPTTSFNATGTGIGGSTTDDSSPQWSYGPIYTPSTPFGDRVGFSQGAGGVATVTLTFAIPMTDVVFHIANLDFSFLDFSGSGPGVTGMTLLSGNGGAGDGIGVSAPLLSDSIPITSDTAGPASPPPVAGPRSAYGSVLFSGTYTTLSFDIIPSGPAGFDDASFTLSSVPEPSSLVAMLLGAGVLALRRRRR